MTTAQLILVLIVIVVAVVVVWLLVRRAAAKKDQARVEAAGLRADAEEVAASMPGQQAFADQAAERASLAQAEAERAAREASRLEAEAGQQRAAVDETRREYAARMARADQVDPDVKDPAPVPEWVEDEPEELPGIESARSSEPATEEDPEERQPATRAEARQRREEAARSAWAGSPAAPVPGAAGAAVVGATTWTGEDETEAEGAVDDDGSAEVDAAQLDAEPGAGGDARVDAEDEDVVEVDAARMDAEPEPPEGAPGEPVDEQRSARIATAADYRDEVEGDAEPADEVWAAAPVGIHGGMTDATEHDDPADDAQTPSGEWGGPHDSSADSDAVTTADDDSATGADARPVDPDTAAADADPETSAIATDSETAAETVTDDEDATPAPAVDGTSDGEPGAAPTEDAPVTGHEPEQEPDTDPYDPTPERDWASDEGALLEENRERGDELARDREEMEHEAAAAGMTGEHAVEAPAEEPETEESAADASVNAEEATAGEPAAADTEDEAPGTDEPTATFEPGTDEPVATDEPDTDEPGIAEEPEAADEPEPDTDAPDSADEHEAPGTDEPESAESAAPTTAGRRVSEFHEIRDGGYGMGSAATIEDGAQPLDHPVAAYEDTMTFREPGAPGWEDATPDVWFYDVGAAERSGFSRSEG